MPLTLAFGNMAFGFVLSYINAYFTFGCGRTAVFQTPILPKAFSVVGNRFMKTVYIFSYIG
jgi:hypothetical protein